MDKLLWVFLFVFVDVLGFSIILPLLPYYAQQFNSSPSTVGLLLTSNAFTQMISAPVIGKLSDYYGRRPLLLLCLAGTVVGFVILGAAQNMFQLFFSRILDGILGGNISLAQAYISDVTSEKDRSKGLGLVGAAFGIGFIIGPAIGGSLSGWYGFRYPAYMAAVVSLVNFVGVMFFLPESLHPSKRSKSLSLFGTTSNTNNSKNNNDNNISTDSTNAAVNIAPPASSHLSAFGQFQFIIRNLFHFSQKNPTAPSGPATLPSSPPPLLLSLLLLRFFYSFTFTLFETCFGFFNINRLLLDVSTSSYLLCYVGVVFSMVQGGGIKTFTKRFPERSIITVSFVLLAVSLLMWSMSFSVTAVLVSLFPLSLCSGLLNTLINSEITKQVEQSSLGALLGISASIGSLTRVLAPISSGLLIEIGGVSAPGIAGAVLMAAMFLYSRNTLGRYYHYNTQTAADSNITTTTTTKTKSQ